VLLIKWCPHHHSQTYAKTDHVSLQSQTKLKYGIMYGCMLDFWKLDVPLITSVLHCMFTLVL